MVPATARITRVARATTLAAIAKSGSASDLIAGTLPDDRLDGTYSHALSLTNVSPSG